MYAARYRRASFNSVVLKTVYVCVLTFDILNDLAVAGGSRCCHVCRGNGKTLVIAVNVQTEASLRRLCNVHNQ